MRLLLDACVWGGTTQALVDRGHDAVWVGEWPSDPGDEDVLAHAFAHQRVLVTLDRDFGELAVVRGQRHAGILRLVALAAGEQAPACLAAIELHGADLAAGAIVTVEPGRVQVRPGGVPPEST